MTEQIKELTFDFHMSRFPINFVDIAKVYSIRDIWIFYAKSATNGVNITNHYLVLFLILKQLTEILMKGFQITAF